MTVEMVRIQTCGEILADLLVIQRANAPKIVTVKIDMRRHRKAQAASGLMNHLHNNPNPKQGKSPNRTKPKTRY